MAKTELITDFAAESDVNLIAAVAMQADDRETALGALGALHARYASWCLGIARFQEYSGIDHIWRCRRLLWRSGGPLVISTQEEARKSEQRPLKPGYPNTEK